MNRQSHVPSDVPPVEQELAKEILKRPGPERRLEGEQRLKDYAKDLLKIKDPGVRGAMTDIVRSGRLKLDAGLMRNLTSLSGKLQGDEKSLVATLEKSEVAQAMDKIEKVLQTDKKVLLQVETARKVKESLSNPDKPVVKITPEKYQSVVGELYGLTIRNFFSSGNIDAISLLREVKPLIAQLKQMEPEAEFINRRVHELHYLGVGFGERVTMSPKEQAPAPAQHPTSETPEERKADFERRTARSNKYHDTGKKKDDRESA